MDDKHEMAIDPALDQMQPPMPQPPPPPPPPQQQQIPPTPLPPPPNPPPPPQQQQDDTRSLNVMDALAYLDDVKVQFQHQASVYNQFLDIMKDFKAQIIDTPGVIRRVSYLFRGHPTLIQGFNTFLPTGYRIDARDANYVVVTTPHGTHTHTTFDDMEQEDTPKKEPTPEPSPRLPEDGQAIEPAVQYVQKIKQRCDPETYRQFLDILSRYHNTPDQADQVSQQISELFKDQPDLRADFRIFMPGSSKDRERDREHRTRRSTPSQPQPPQPSTSTSTRPTRATRTQQQQQQQPLPPAVPEKKGDSAQVSGGGAKRKLEGESSVGKLDATAPAQKRSKRGRTDENQREPGVSRRDGTKAETSKPKKPKSRTQTVTQAPTNPDQVFFDHVRRALDNRETYHEFLALINLFTQNYIDISRLVYEARNFLGEGTELYIRFCVIVGWDENKERERRSIESARWSAIQRVKRDVDKADQDEDVLEIGSYRRVAKHDRDVLCSGRDELCKSVLNDEWVARPSRLSEEQGFIAHKKNIYEEALHRSEEERHEYDFHLDAISRTITILDPICAKINQLAPEERAGFKLKHGLTGTAKAIHGRVIKKIYGREAGYEVMKAVNEQPGLAVPVVFARLRQKEDEWKKAQREWNKVWREVDARNYIKSLDHQAITFKAADKRALSTRVLIGQIEAKRDEQNARKAALVDPLFGRTRARHHMHFVLEDERVMNDTVKLVCSFLDRTAGQIGVQERKRIENFLRSFVPMLFALDSTSFANPASEDPNNDASNRTGAGGQGQGQQQGKNGNDLRKTTLKSEQAKTTGRRTRASSPVVSRFASPVVLDETRSASPTSSASSSQASSAPRRKYLFFANSTFYVFLRLFEALYSRLHFFKQLTRQLVSEDRRMGNGYMADKEANGGVYMNPEYFYDQMLESCERLFDNEIEQHAFEEQLRTMFGFKDAYRLFTVDKVIGSIVKQVQAVIADSHSQELLEPLKRERAMANPTMQDHTNNRKNAEKVLGPDENLFRFDWHPDSKELTIQFIGKDDDDNVDSEVLAGRWQEYLNSYVTTDETFGVNQAKMGKPFLRRNLPKDTTLHPKITARNGLEIKICVRTYRMFYVSHTEDCFKNRGKGEAAEDLAIKKRLVIKEKMRARWMEKEKNRPVHVAVASAVGEPQASAPQGPAEGSNSPAAVAIVSAAS